MSGRAMRLTGISIVLMFLLVPFVYASDTSTTFPFTHSDNGTTIRQYIHEVKAQNASAVLADKETPSSFDITHELESQNPDFDRKSVVKAFVYSAILPGAGQLYTSSKTKALVFFSVEALAWTGHIVYHKKGDDNTDVYQNFADTHWLESRYSNWLNLHWGVNDDDSVFNDLGFSLFTHHLPDTKTQQYYEMIGKYNQFVYGWDDTGDLQSSDSVPHPETYSPRRMTYEGLRHDANRMYDRATTSLIVMMANHLISGFEAAWAARNHNRHVAVSAQRLSLNAQTARLDDNYFPMLTMTYRF